VRSEETLLRELAGEHGASIESMLALLADMRARVGAGDFYVFWAGGQGAPSGGQRRQRTLLAFMTPDTALAFAQQNYLRQAGGQPRLRHLTLLQLVHAILREPAITALLFVAELDDQSPPAGRLPDGTRVERAELLQRLHGDGDPAI
jgi:hypothetical protein